MTNWRQFKITNKDASNTRYIRFYLDGYVRYNNGSESRVDCENRTPFDNWVIGDMIEIDTDRACNYGSGHEFPDTSIVRKSPSIVLYNPSSSSVIPSGFRDGFLSSVADSYQRGEDFEAYVEHRESDGRASFRWYGSMKDKKFDQGGYDRRRS